MSIIEMIPPRVRSTPDCSSSLGMEAIDFCRSIGLGLDDWQELVLAESLGLKETRKWSAFEVAVNVARQNGKNEIALARELIGMFLIGEELCIHSAHEFKTSTEHQRRVEQIIQDTPDLHARVKKNGYKHSHGEEGIELRSGQRIRFMTRTKGGGRGHTGDLVVFDEAMILASAMLGALMPTLSARSILGNPQLWYFATAADKMIQDHALVFARIRERGLAGSDPSLAYFEWSADIDCDPSSVPAEVASDPAVWAQANPALGIRISEEHVENEQRSMDARTFAVERLGIGAWPDADGDESVIDAAAWAALADPLSTIDGAVCFAFDIPPDRSSATIAAAGLRPDGLLHVEVVDNRRGTGWVVDRIRELSAKHATSTIVCDGSGPAGSLLHELLPATDVTAVNAREHGQACGLLYDMVDQQRLRHLGTGDLAQSVRGAVKRPLGDSWAWSRRNSTTDISPLVASTLALWGSTEAKSEVWASAW